MTTATTQFFSVSFVNNGVQWEAHLVYDRNGEKIQTANKNMQRIYTLPPDIGVAPERRAYLMIAVDAVGKYIELDPFDRKLSEQFSSLLEKGYEFYYYSEDNGGYCEGQGKHQRLYDALCEYIPCYGYPKFKSLDAKIAEAVAVVYLLTRLQYEWFNNGCCNIDTSSIMDVQHEWVRDVSDVKFLPRRVGHNYYLMIKYLADKHDMKSAENLVESYDAFIEEECYYNDSEENPPKECIYSSSDEYISGEDSEYDEDIDREKNKMKFERRRRKTRNQYFQRIDKERDESLDALQESLSDNMKGLGCDVMSHVLSILTPEQVQTLEECTPDPNTKARFNRLGVCYCPGLHDGETYRLGEFKRLSQDEIKRQENRKRKIELCEEANKAKEASAKAIKLIEENEKDLKALEEEFKKKACAMAKIRADLERQVRMQSEKAESASAEALNLDNI